MKILKFIVLILIIFGASAAVYFLFVVKSPKTSMFDDYLKNSAVFYHRSSPEVTDRVIYNTSNESSVFDFLNDLSPQSELQKTYNRGDAVVSWHLSRQEELTPVVWVFLPDNYKLKNDSLPSGKKVGDLIEIQSSEKSIFMAHSKRYAAIGSNGEIMQQISTMEFQITEVDKQMAANMVSGNMAKLRTYMKQFLPCLESLAVADKSYSVSFFGNENVSLFHGYIDSSILAGISPSRTIDNVAIPVSAQCLWYCKFDNALSFVQLMNKQNSQLVWDLEARYQFKIQEPIEAWFDGTAAWFYYSKDAQKGMVAALKLRNDAAPFAAANQFFTDLSTIDIKKEKTTDYYTMARFMPGELAQVVLPGAKDAKNLFVLQYGNYLYLSANKTLLTMVVNELVNNRLLVNMTDVGNANATFYFNMKHLQKNITIQGRLLEYNQGLYMQGSVNNEDEQSQVGL